MNENIEKCLVPGCSELEVARGLCSGHYQNARRLIKRDKITWEILIQQGKAKKRKNKKQSATTFFLDGQQNLQRITEE